jgi:hypothetical protein
MAYAYGLSFLLWITIPSSNMFIQFPIFGVVISGEPSVFVMTLTCVQPAFWVYFIGPVLFYPNMKLKNKAKKFSLLLLSIHLVNFLIMYVELVIIIMNGIPWVVIHAGDLSIVITSIIKGISTFLVVLKLFPEVKNLII